jgi:hypothetical protein
MYTSWVTLGPPNLQAAHTGSYAFSSFFALSMETSKVAVSRAG